ncbi:MAG: putative signal peptide-containing protein [Ilumatobacteraceae bacterium]|nr:putative signal peptide-containing protein [Ilumatobacteraceae bacterium]
MNRWSATATRYAAAVGMLLAAAGCSSSAAPPATATVVLVGDSLGVQAAPYLEPLVAPRPFVAQVFGGSAPCDWLGKDLQISSGSEVVITFDGNSSSRCMGDGAGGFLQGQAIVDKYRSDLTTLISQARNAGAHVLLVGQPVHAASVPGNDVVLLLDALYKSMASSGGVAYVDAGKAVENDDGTFAKSLPCLPGEAQCDPSGFNVVRNDDGLHFCPGSPPPGPCAAYSSGAFRFAKAIADAINAP